MDWIIAERGSPIDSAYSSRIRIPPVTRGSFALNPDEGEHPVLLGGHLDLHPGIILLEPLHLVQLDQPIPAHHHEVLGVEGLVGQPQLEQFKRI
jgi:hypothetical protein